METVAVTNYTTRYPLSDFCVDGRLELWTMKSARQ